MRISFSVCQQLPQPGLVNFPGPPGGLINMDQLIIPRQRRKDKVVVVMGATGTGKSRLSIDLATRFDAEIINSDKMQVYRGLNVVTNKVTDEESRGVPHHLLGIAEPDSDFSARDFVRHAMIAVKAITGRGRLPIVAGGSNSCIRALVHDDIDFQSRYECCFLCVDVSLPILHSFVSGRVDQMVQAGLVDESREFYEPGGDYSRGIRQAIGVPELDGFFRNENLVDDETRAKLLEECVESIKANTRDLACRQLDKILKLEEDMQCRIHRLSATEAFLKDGEEANEAWEKLVVGPSTRVVGRFLCEDDDRVDFVSAIKPPTGVAALGPANVATVTAATH